MLTPFQRLDNLIESIKTADDYYDDDHPLMFATERQVSAINIALHKIIKRIKKPDRIDLLALLAGRKKCFFSSSRDYTLAGANALISSLYGEAIDLKTADMDQAVVAAIAYAYGLMLFRRENPEHTWAEQLPPDGESIEAWSEPMTIWIHGVFCEDDSLSGIEWDDGTFCELEEYGADVITKWRKEYAPD